MGTLVTIRAARPRRALLPASALDWADVTSALRADPVAAAQLAERISGWPGNSHHALEAAKARLDGFVKSGQLGISSPRTSASATIGRSSIPWRRSRGRDGNGCPGPYEAALVGNPIADPRLPLEALRTLHSFDPCLACAIHALDAHGEEIACIRAV